MAYKIDQKFHKLDPPRGKIGKGERGGGAVPFQARSCFFPDKDDIVFSEMGKRDIGNKAGKRGQGRVIQARGLEAVMGRGAVLFVEPPGDGSKGKRVIEKRAESRASNANGEIEIDFLTGTARAGGVETIGEISQWFPEIAETIKHLIASTPTEIPRNTFDPAARRDDIFNLCPGEKTFPPGFDRIRAQNRAKFEDITSFPVNPRYFIPNPREKSRSANAGRHQSEKQAFFPARVLPNLILKQGPPPNFPILIAKIH
ncbi:MAG: hypothetical protein GY859_19215 [Desulfobacterales bacterium]|nr:hypothetical protein [Desulfobacterales bacterium]